MQLENFSERQNRRKTKPRCKGFKKYFTLCHLQDDISRCIFKDIYSDILSGKCSDILFYINSGRLSGIYSDILSDTNSGILSGICSDNLTVYLTFYLAYIPTFYLAVYLAFYLAHILTFLHSFLAAAPGEACNSTRRSAQQRPKLPAHFPVCFPSPLLGVQNDNMCPRLQL